MNPHPNPPNQNGPPFLCRTSYGSRDFSGMPSAPTVKWFEEFIAALLLKSCRGIGPVSDELLVAAIFVALPVLEGKRLDSVWKESSPVDSAWPDFSRVN